MLDAAKKFNQEFEEVFELYMKQLASADMFTDMTPETLLLLKKSIKLLDSSMDYFKLQAKTMDDINNKLDMLLASK